MTGRKLVSGDDVVTTLYMLRPERYKNILAEICVRLSHGSVTASDVTFPVIRSHPIGSSPVSDDLSLFVSLF